MLSCLARVLGCNSEVGQATVSCISQRCWLELAQHWWSLVVLASPLPAFLQKLLDLCSDVILATHCL